jgi:hypothetical protein
MITNSFEGKIIRVDGFGPEETTCKVFSNDVLQDEFIPLLQQKSVQLSGKGLFRFEFSSATIQKTVSLKLDLFTDDGAQWLPLFDCDTVLADLPEETSSPRFLLVLCHTKALHVIEESNEIYEDSSLTVSESEEIAQDANLCGQEGNDCLTQQDLLESVESGIFDQSSIHEDYSEANGVAYSEQLNRIWEPDGSVCNESLERQSFEVAKEVQGLRNALEESNFKLTVVSKMHLEEVREKGEILEKLGKAMENNKEQGKRSLEREESLLELVAEKENEAKVAQDEIFLLRNAMKKLEFENKRLKDINEGLIADISVLSTIQQSDEISRLNSKILELQNLLVKTNTLQYEQRISEQELTIHVLQQQIHRLRPSDSDTRESQNSSLFIIDELDEAVRNHTKMMSLPEPIIRDKEQMYIYGHRKMSLLLQNGQLMCRIGGSFKPFKEYMDNYVLENVAVRPFKKRFSVDQNIDSEYDADKFKEAVIKARSTGQRVIRTGTAKRKTRS